MKGLTVDAKGKLSIQELDMPVFNDCQALVKTKSCGVCSGTDLKLIHGTFKNFDTYPAVLGHEAVGEVVAIGSRVKSMKVGDLVLLPFLEEANRGYYPGWGGYAEYAIVGDAQAYIESGKGIGSPHFQEGYLAQTVLRKSDKVDAVGASMIITFREVLSAIRRFDFQANKSVLIYGAGPVGLCFVRFAKLLGLKNVISVDIMEEKNHEARRMGADLVINSTKEDVVKKVKSIFPDGLDYIVDAVGINQLINQAMEMIAYNGKICCYGISPKLEMNLDWGKAPYNWSLDFIQWPSKKEEGEAHQQIMAWINLGVLDPYDFISDIIPFDNILHAFAVIEEKKPQTKKIVIQYE